MIQMDCTACGAVVSDQERHAAFHRALKDLRDTSRRQAEALKKVIEGLHIIAPLLYEMAQAVEGPAPPEIAREIEKLLAEMKKP